MLIYVVATLKLGGATALQAVSVLVVLLIFEKGTLLNYIMPCHRW